MENNKEDIIVVLAGYKDRMDAFYGFIPVGCAAHSRCVPPLPAVAEPPQPPLSRRRREGHPPT